MRIDITLALVALVCSATVAQAQTQLHAPDVRFRLTLRTIPGPVGTMRTSASPWRASIAMLSLPMPVVAPEIPELGSMPVAATNPLGFASIDVDQWWTNPLFRPATPRQPARR